MESLSVEDLELLIESVEAWENKDQASDIMTTLVDGMLMRSVPPDEVERVKAQRESEAKRKAAERQIYKERSVLLRAKLFSILADRRVIDVTRNILHASRGQDGASRIE